MTGQMLLLAAEYAASPSPLPSGDVDGDSNDWTGIPFVFLGILAVVLVVAVVIIARYRGHRDKTDASDNNGSIG